VSEARLCFTVPPSCFYPEPDVDSALLHIDTRRGRTEDMVLLNRTIKAAFAMRRKTLANNLSAAFPLTKTQIEQILTQMDIEPTVRAETLLPAQFERIARQICRAMKK
jgi:16S rRNA (adenine1518-N6/adenine1519-N6)-dimethyltransferase